MSLEDTIKEIKTVLENIDNDEFDETQIKGVVFMVRKHINETKYQSIVDFLNDSKIEKTRNNVLTYIMNLTNLDLTPYEIED